ncbi:MAG: hypothetical protein IJK04_00600 [Kiritimatiellae bacterium]|nr:hypothetical protein [Kiritimatiellia bacterium]
MMDIRGSGGARLFVELFGSAANGRKIIAWAADRMPGRGFRGGAQPRLRMVESRR